MKTGSTRNEENIQILNYREGCIIYKFTKIFCVIHFIQMNAMLRKLHFQPAVNMQAEYSRGEKFHSKETESGKCWRPASFLLVMWFETQGHQVEPPSFRMSLPTSTNVIKELFTGGIDRESRWLLPHRDKLISWVILHPVKLVINYHN